MKNSSINHDNINDDVKQGDKDYNLEDYDVYYNVHLLDYRPASDDLYSFSDQTEAVDFAKVNQSEHAAVSVERIVTDYMNNETHEIIYEHGRNSKQ